MGSLIAASDLIGKPQVSLPKRNLHLQLYQSITFLVFLDLHNRKTNRLLIFINFRTEKRPGITRGKRQTCVRAPPQSGAWLAANPITALDLHFNPNEFRLSLIDKLEKKLRLCDKKPMLHLQHSLLCHERGVAIARHDIVRDQSQQLFQRLIVLQYWKNKTPITDSNLREGSISCHHGS